MEVIWQGEATESTETALRLIMDDQGLIMFQCWSIEWPEWTDVDEVPVAFQFAV